MASPIFHPLSEADREQLCAILHSTKDVQVWEFLCEVFQNIFSFNNDQDIFREKMVTYGQGMFHYMLLKLQSRFTNPLFTYKHTSKSMFYRYIWMEVDGGRENDLHVLTKGALWFDKLTSALTSGRKYPPSIDFVTKRQSQLILSVESMCRCQMLPSNLTGDVFTIDNCHCDGRVYVARRKLARQNPCTSSHPQTCVVNDNQRVLVIRLAASIVDMFDNKMYCFCIPRSDTYFMSKSEKIPQAFREYLRNA